MLGMTVTTPSAHYHYVDISRTQNGVFYGEIIATPITNAAIMVCAYRISDTQFRIIFRDSNGSGVNYEVRANIILFNRTI